MTAETGWAFCGGCRTLYVGLEAFALACKCGVKTDVQWATDVRHQKPMSWAEADALVRAREIVTDPRIAVVSLSRIWWDSTPTYRIRLTYPLSNGVQGCGATCADLDRLLTSTLPAVVAGAIRHMDVLDREAT